METLFIYRWSLASLFCLLLPLLGIVGTRLHWWPYTLGLLLLLAGLGCALLLLPLALWQRQWLAMVPPALLLLLVLPFVIRAFTLPAIHDISTDTRRPPALTAALTLRSASDHDTDYAGEALAQQQQATWPEIKPLIVHAPIKQVHTQVKVLIARRGWTITANSDTQLEAVARSTLFGFSDDIAIRLTPVALSDTGSAEPTTSDRLTPNQQPSTVATRVDMRSASRVGKSDLGANAERVRAFLTELDQL
ncbi:DUF1499 domain-containing protein [Oceanisphaera sp.]|uniref:DUF1499 domain-containing protein n=1 Tax=Oceanisphaera sp. TaxID=1929979 RepID=UPI003A920C1B